MELRPIERPTERKWEEMIAPFNSRSIFHSSAWLEFLQKAYNGKPKIFQIKNQNVNIGYFIGLIARKGPFKILGSPLRGWTTQFMGPIVDSDFNQNDMLIAFDEYCRRNSISQMEFSSPLFAADIVRERGFKCNRDVTPILDLRTDTKSVWKRLRAKSCRYKVRKALREGVRVENTEDPAFAEVYYKQLIMVFSRQNLTPTYNLKTVRSLLECLLKRNMLICLEAKYAGKTIATGIFPHDKETIYFWGGASDPRLRSVCPNELIQWHLIKTAMERGIKKYDMYGGDNPFKMKFGCHLKDVYYCYKSFNKVSGVSRKLYASYHDLRQKMLGRLMKWKLEHES